MQKLTTYILVWILVIWIWVWVSFFMRSEQPTKAEIIQTNLSKMYARQSEARMKTIELKLLKKKLDAQLDKTEQDIAHWENEHNWTFEIIENYEKDLVATQ